MGAAIMKRSSAAAAERVALAEEAEAEAEALAEAAGAGAAAAAVRRSDRHWPRPMSWRRAAASPGGVSRARP